LIRYIVISIVLLTGIFSCNKDVLTSASWKFPDHHWITGDNKLMNIHAPDSTQAYAMDIRIEHSDAYQFQNLYIRVSTIFPSGKEIKSVTSLELSNPDGSWAGKCNGSSCSVTLPLQHGFNFPEIGEYKLTIEPYMRIDTIDGLKRMTVICRKREK
jgi:gliding motility-associated lipoprotein GldH